MRLTRKLIKALILLSPLRGIYKEGLIQHIGLLAVNWIFQRIFQVNGDTAWSVNFTSRVVIPRKVKFGQGVLKSFVLSGGCYIQGGNGVYIGEDTIFGPGVKIISANHDPHSKSFEWVKTSAINIGKHCWIGANAVILPGVNLGNNVTVAAGAVVTRSFSSNLTIGGIPARIIKT